MNKQATSFKLDIGDDALKNSTKGITLEQMAREYLKNGLCDAAASMMWIDYDRKSCIMEIFDNGTGMLEKDWQAFCCPYVSGKSGNANATARFGTGGYSAASFCWGGDGKIVITTCHQDTPNQVVRLVLRPHEVIPMIRRGEEMKVEFLEKNSETWPGYKYGAEHGTHFAIHMTPTPTGRKRRPRMDLLAQKLSAFLPSGFSDADDPKVFVQKAPLPQKQVEGEIFARLIKGADQLGGELYCEFYQPKGKPIEGETICFSDHAIGEVSLHAIRKVLGNKVSQLHPIYLSGNLAGVISFPAFGDYVDEKRVGVNDDFADFPGLNQLLRELNIMAPAVSAATGVRTGIAEAPKGDKAVISQFIKSANELYEMPEDYQPKIITVETPGDSQGGKKTIHTGGIKGHFSISMRSGEIGVSETMKFQVNVHSTRLERKDLSVKVSPSDCVTLKDHGDGDYSLTINSMPDEKMVRLTVSSSIIAQSKSRVISVVKQRKPRLDPNGQEVTSVGNSIVFQIKNADMILDEKGDVIPADKLQWSVDGFQAELEEDSDHPYRMIVHCNSVGTGTVMVAPKATPHKTIDDCRVTVTPRDDEEVLLNIEGHLFRVTTTVSASHRFSPVKMVKADPAIGHMLFIYSGDPSYIQASQDGKLGKSLAEWISSTYAEFLFCDLEPPKGADEMKSLSDGGRKLHERISTKAIEIYKKYSDIMGK